MHLSVMYALCKYVLMVHWAPPTAHGTYYNTSLHQLDGSFNFPLSTPIERICFRIYATTALALTLPVTRAAKISNTRYHCVENGMHPCTPYKTRQALHISSLIGKDMTCGDVGT